MQDVSFVRKLSYGVGLTILTLAGCSGSSGSASGTLAELASAEADITDTVESREATRAEVEACIATFRSCESADAGAESCRAALEACLPEGLPIPRHCGDGGLDHLDDGEEGDRHHRGGRDKRRDDGDLDESAEESADQDADVDEASEEASDGDVRHHRGRGGHRGGRSCGPRVHDERLRECRVAAASELAQGTDPDAVATAHAACTGPAFEERLAQLCERATSLCTREDAQADLCARITEACTAAASATP